MAITDVILVYILLCLASASRRTSNVDRPPCTATSTKSFYWKKLDHWPNICAVEEVTGSRKRYYSECMAYMPRTICAKPTFIRYHCCTGYERVDDDAKGCEGVKPMTNLMEMAKHMYLSELRKYARKSGMDGVLRHNGIFTVFAPHNDAFKQVTSAKKTLLSSTNLDENLIKYHMTPGRKYLRNLYDNLQLPSMLPSDTSGSHTGHRGSSRGVSTLIESEHHAPLKINRYSNGIVTVNCARIILPDQVATNGVLHTLEKVIAPIQNNATIMDMLVADDRFGELVTAMVITGFTSKLLDKNKDYTLFAPTDAAFRAAPPDVMERILNNKDVLKKLLQYHILDQSICSAAILGLSRQRTLHGHKLNLTCDVNDNLRVNDVRVTSSDHVGINGVFHVIDQLLIPPEAKSLGEALSDLGMHEFVEYAQGAGLTSILKGMDDGNYTVFVPSAAAFKALSREQKRTLQTQRDARNRVFNYHVVPGKFTTDDMEGDQMLTTNSEGRQVRVKVYYKGFGINGAKIISSNHIAGNGVVHVIDKMLFPPEGSAMDRVQEESKLSTFISTLQSTGLDVALRDIKGNYTVFAPTNDAFDAMEGPLLENLLVDQSELQKFLNYHILKHPVYPSSIKPALRYRFKTLAREWLSLRQDTEDEPIVVNGEAKVEGHEVESSNGVVYHIDTVLKCPCVDSMNDNDIV